MWVPLAKVNHLWPGSGHMLGQIRAVTTGLLVGELAGHEGRRRDLVHEGQRRHRISDRRHVVLVAVHLGDQVDCLSVEGLIGLAHGVALLDTLVGPRLAAGSGRGQRVMTRPSPS